MFRDISAALCASSGGSNLNNDKKKFKTYKYFLSISFMDSSSIALNNVAST